MDMAEKSLTEKIAARMAAQINATIAANETDGFIEDTNPPTTSANGLLDQDQVNKAIQVP